MDLLRFSMAMRPALYQCGQVARALQGHVAREEKAPDSPYQMSTSVSVVDRLCQEILLLRAHEAAPYLEVQSEEMADCPEEILVLYAGRSHQYALILDPVDGTGDYLDGGPTYAVMLGLLNQETGRIDLSLIYFPARLRLYEAIRGMGAFVANGLFATPQRLPQPQRPPRTVERVKRLEPADLAAFDRLGFDVVPPESGCAAHELTRVAEGRLGAMVMRHFHGHDTAVSSLIVESLGGAVLTAPARPVTYEIAMPRMPLVVSSLVPEYAEALSAACAGAAAGHP